MGIELGSNFDMKAALPLDSRLKVADLTARDAIVSGIRYEGMIVYVVSEQTNYQLVAGVTNANWTELSGSGSGGGALNFLTNGSFEKDLAGWQTYVDYLNCSSVDTLGDAIGVKKVTTTGAVQAGQVLAPMRLRYIATTPNGGMTTATDYYVLGSVIGYGNNTSEWGFQISTSVNGAAIDLTSAAGVNLSGFYPYRPVAGVPGNYGVVTLTAARVSTDPLRGKGSLQIVKPASLTLGQGISYDFEIPRGYRGQVLSIDMLMEIISGTYASGDFEVWVYDKTNGVMIQPANYQIQNVGTAGPIRQMSFASAINSTSYRLIIHSASTSTSAFTVNFDDVSVGPLLLATGSPNTSGEYVAAANQSLTTATDTVVNFATRNRDTNGSFSGTVFTAKEAGVFQFEGLVGFATSATGLRRVYFRKNGGAVQNAGYEPGGRVGILVVPFAFEQELLVGETVEILARQESGGALNTDLNFTRLYFSKIRDTIAGVGASSPNVAATGLYKFGGTFPASSAITAWTSTLEDTHGEVNLTDGTVTVKVPGTRIIVASVAVPTASNAIFGPVVNGAILDVWSVDSTLTLYKTVVAVAHNLKVGDVIAIRNGGSGTGSITNARFSTMMFASLPQLQAATRVDARYATATAQSIPNTTATILNFDTKTYDSHDQVTTGAAWKFTAKTAGEYDVRAKITFTAFSAVGTIYLSIYKNGVEYSRSPYTFSVATSQNYGVQIADSVPLLAGEYIDVRLYQGSGASQTLLANAATNTVAISRIGS